MNTIGKSISDAARAHNLAPSFLAALVHIESRGEPDAMRYEPGFFIKYIRPKSDKELGGFWPGIYNNATERNARACSYGLCQVMGQKAREMGFTGSWREFIDVETNLEYGAKIISDLIASTDDVTQALLRYNGGGNLTYPDKFFEALDKGHANYLLL